MSPSDKEATDLATSWGTRLAIALEDVCPISGHDAYNIYWEAFESDISIPFLQQMNESDYEQLLSAARDFLEMPSVDMTAIRQAVADTIWDRTDDSEGDMA
jgi:hypothetical protein